jgi:hypothetical protein
MTSRSTPIEEITAFKGEHSAVLLQGVSQMSQATPREGRVGPRFSSAY